MSVILGPHYLSLEGHITLLLVLSLENHYCPLGLSLILCPLSLGLFRSVPLTLLSLQLHVHEWELLCLPGTGERSKKTPAHLGMSMGS